MLITISVLACFPQSVSADIFWRPWSFNTFTANGDALAASLMKHLLRESHVGCRPHPESLVRGLRTRLLLCWEKELCFWVMSSGRSAWGTPHHPDRPPLIWIHQFRTWPPVCTGGGQQMKGWLQTEPLQGHTCLHSLQSSKSVGRPLCREPIALKWSHLTGHDAYAACLALESFWGRRIARVLGACSAH